MKTHQSKNVQFFELIFQCETKLKFYILSETGKIPVTIFTNFKITDKILVKYLSFK